MQVHWLSCVDERGRWEPVGLVPWNFAARFLCATDLSDAADAALRQAYAIGTQIGAPIGVCHVLPEAFNARVLFPHEAGVDTSFQAELTHKATTAVRASATDSSPTFVPRMMRASLNSRAPEEQRRPDPPLYAAFFVLAGAELVPLSVLGFGVIGLGYTAARTVEKIVGARIGLRGQECPMSCDGKSGASFLRRRAPSASRFRSKRPFRIRGHDYGHRVGRRRDP